MRTLEKSPGQLLSEKMTYEISRLLPLEAAFRFCHTFKQLSTSQKQDAIMLIEDAMFCGDYFFERLCSRVHAERLRQFSQQREEHTGYVVKL